MTLNIREILRIDNFNPLDVDISFLKEVSNMIPQGGYIDPAMAEQLATICLRAADFCVDLLGQSTLYLSHCDAQRRASKAEAILDCLSNKVPSTIVKEVALSNADYVEKTNLYNMALGWHTWLEAKRETLIKTHHLCKDLVRKSESSANTNWEPSIPESSRATKSFLSKEDDLPSNNKHKKEVGSTSWTKQGSKF